MRICRACRTWFFDWSSAHGTRWVVNAGKPAGARCGGGSQKRRGPHQRAGRRGSSALPRVACGAQKRTRTSTKLPPLAPEASASTNSAIWALKAANSAGSARPCQCLRATRRPAAHAPPGTARSARRSDRPTASQGDAPAAAAWLGHGASGNASRRRIARGHLLAERSAQARRIRQKTASFMRIRTRRASCARASGTASNKCCDAAAKTRFCRLTAQRKELACMRRTAPPSPMLRSSA